MAVHNHLRSGTQPPHSESFKNLVTFKISHVTGLDLENESGLKSYGKLKQISEKRFRTHKAWDGLQYLNF